jgi:hypothetical protein
MKNFRNYARKPIANGSIKHLCTQTVLLRIFHRVEVQTLSIIRLAFLLPDASGIIKLAGGDSV